MEAGKHASQVLSLARRCNQILQKFVFISCRRSDQMSGCLGKYLVTTESSEFGIRYLTSKLNGGKLYKGSYRLEDLVEQIPRVNVVQHDFIDKDKAAYFVRLNWKSREDVKPSTASSKVLQKLKSIFNDVRIRNKKQSAYVEER